ncbi:SprA-related family [Desulfocapsa sulfexigens DSM 10523]|uniref:SprA-related family n=1 Tax=Desulfocapsa sulfexigens (strain DSM 10523 / SB164P1) TaxID=1167006 RepID=M1NJD7_DESSD|nr:putative metalloprotease CJM1_0395 family protein [Desulfocapsa sulfexigens]AGF79679.1 SprA-related family [Desulfocapsa sulfexigens DSM 10523]
MMQTVSHSYSAQVYSQVQNTSAPLQRKVSTTGQVETPHPFASQQQSTDDSISLSPEGKELSQREANSLSVPQKEKSLINAQSSTENDTQQALSQEDLRLITDLQKRDAEVRSHEQAHLSAAGQYAAGGASFSYTTGPNGKKYATGGEVPIDIAKEKTPEATIQKMRTVRRAALAPANPSATDRSIAAQASSKEAQAMKELLEQAQISPPTPSPLGDTAIAENTTNRDTAGVEENPTEAPGNMPQVSDISRRRSMTSAYQAIAALAT